MTPLNKHTQNVYFFVVVKFCLFLIYYNLNISDTHFKGDVLDIIPNVAARAVENTPRVEALRDVIGDYLIPLVLKHLGSSDTVLDKKAQDVLVQLLQRGFVSQFQAEVKICPSVLALTKMEGQVDILPSAVRVSVLLYSFMPNLNV